MARKAKKKDGFFEPNYLILLEGRISSIIYRVNFSSNLFEALKVARLGVIWFNKKFRSRANFVVSLMKFVGLHFLFKGFVYYNLVRRLIKKSVLQGFPKYIFMSYIFLTFFFKRLPRLKDYINPIPIDCIELQVMLFKKCL
jgi:ribosomal protein S4